MGSGGVLGESQQDWMEPDRPGSQEEGCGVVVLKSSENKPGCIQAGYSPLTFRNAAYVFCKALHSWHVDKGSLALGTRRQTAQ